MHDALDGLRSCEFIHIREHQQQTKLYGSLERTDHGTISITGPWHAGQQVSMRLGDDTRHCTINTCPGTCMCQHATRQSPVTAHAPGHRDQSTCQPGRRPDPQTPAPQAPAACQGVPSARTIGGARWCVCCLTAYEASVTALPRTRRAVGRGGGQTARSPGEGEGEGEGEGG